jgi:hypothetical protein
MVLYNPELPLFSLHIPKTAGVSFERVLQRWFNHRPFPNLNNHPRLYKMLTPVNLDFVLQRMLGCGLYLHYSNEYFKRPPRRVPLGLKYGLLQRRPQPECVHGHFDPNTGAGDLFGFYPGASQFITFLRDPLEMQLSLFFYLKNLINTGTMYWQGKRVTNMEYDGDIDRWVEERGFYMLGFLPFELTMNNYKDVINQYFVHIGVTEHMQQSVNIMAGKLNFQSYKVTTENVTQRDIRPSESAVNKFKKKHELEYSIYRYACLMNQV